MHQLYFVSSSSVQWWISIGSVKAPDQKRHKMPLEMLLAAWAPQAEVLDQVGKIVAPADH